MEAQEEASDFSSIESLDGDYDMVDLLTSSDEADDAQGPEIAASLSNDGPPPADIYNNEAFASASASQTDSADSTDSSESPLTPSDDDSDRKHSARGPASDEDAELDLSALLRMPSMAISPASSSLTARRRRRSTAVASAVASSPNTPTSSVVIANADSTDSESDGPQVTLPSSRFSSAQTLHAPGRSEPGGRSFSRFKNERLNVISYSFRPLDSARGASKLKAQANLSAFSASLPPDAYDVVHYLGFADKAYKCLASGHVFPEEPLAIDALLNRGVRVVLLVNYEKSLSNTNLSAHLIKWINALNSLATKNGGITVLPIVEAGAESSKPVILTTANGVPALRGTPSAVLDCELESNLFKDWLSSGSFVTTAPGNVEPMNKYTLRNPLGSKFLGILGAARRPYLLFAWALLFAYFVIPSFSVPGANYWAFSRVPEASRVYERVYDTANTQAPTVTKTYILEAPTVTKTHTLVTSSVVNLSGLETVTETIILSMAPSALTSSKSAKHKACAPVCANRFCFYTGSDLARGERASAETKDLTVSPQDRGESSEPADSVRDSSNLETNPVHDDAENDNIYENVIVQARKQGQDVSKLLHEWVLSVYSAVPFVPQNEEEFESVRAAAKKILDLQAATGDKFLEAVGDTVTHASNFAEDHGLKVNVAPHQEWLESVKSALQERLSVVKCDADCRSQVIDGAVRQAAKANSASWSAYNSVNDVVTEQVIPQSRKTFRWLNGNLQEHLLPAAGHAFTNAKDYVASLNLNNKADRTLRQVGDYFDSLKKRMREADRRLTERALRYRVEKNDRLTWGKWLKDRTAESNNFSWVKCKTSQWQNWLTGKSVESRNLWTSCKSSQWRDWLRNRAAQNDKLTWMKSKTSRTNNAKESEKLTNTARWSAWSSRQKKSSTFDAVKKVFHHEPSSQGKAKSFWSNNF